MCLHRTKNIKVIKEDKNIVMEGSAFYKNVKEIMDFGKRWNRKREIND